MNFPQIKVGIVDDHCLIRQGIIGLLSKFDDLKIILEASNGEELLKNIPNHIPDVLLLDLKMPMMNGTRTLKILNEKYPTLRILILSAFLDDIYISECLDYGINGFLSKSMRIEEIVKAIRIASQNEVYLSNIFSNTLLRKYVVENRKQDKKLLPEFTHNEIRLTELLSQEKTTEEISKLLFLSKRSVEIKREKIKEKANVKTIGGLLLYCLRHGILD